MGVLIFLLDNYDSFTYNLAQYMMELGARVLVRRNDQVTPDEVFATGADGIVVSPGPGRPDDAGITLDLIRKSVSRKIPLLGVCLGHQAIGRALGGRIVRAARLMHGKTSLVRHDGKGVFRGIESPLQATRYHSLVVAPESLPERLVATAFARDGDDDVIMGLRHRDFPAVPLEGVQFHPESILTRRGKKLLANFLEDVKRC